MGQKHSEQAKEFNDYKIVKVPKGYSLIKMSSFDVGLKNTTNAELKIKDIIGYLSSAHKNKSIDIINLQGIYDVLALHLLVREYKQYCIENHLKVYFAPDFDDIDGESKSDGSRQERRSKNLSEFNKDTFELGKRKVVHNIIISTYPVISTIHGELNDIFGTQNVIGVNILINQTIMSVYNVSLCKDVKPSNIINDNVRKSELETLACIIKKNKQMLENNIYDIYIRSEIHMIVGVLNITEIENDNVNPEYAKLIMTNNVVDIFRSLSGSDFGYTTQYKERLSYMLLHYSDTMINKIKETDELMKFIFKTYKIHFIESYVIDSIGSINYPLELTFMLKTS